MQYHVARLEGGGAVKGLVAGTLKRVHCGERGIAGEGADRDMSWKVFPRGPVRSSGVFTWIRGA
jgi:hypothetical protein